MELPAMIGSLQVVDLAARLGQSSRSIGRVCILFPRSSGWQIPSEQARERG